MRSAPILILIYIIRQLGVDYLGLLFDLLLFERVKVFVSEVHWIPVLYTGLVLGFKLSCMCFVIKIAMIKKKTVMDKKSQMISYKMLVYEIFWSKSNQETYKTD